MSAAKVKGVVADLVERSRLGDQNAAAHLARVGEMVREGTASPLTRQAFGYALEYAEKGTEKKRKVPPMGHDATILIKASAQFGSEPTHAAKLLLAFPTVGGERAANALVIALADRPPDPTLVAGALPSLEEAKEFLSGVDLRAWAPYGVAAAAGAILGMALALAAVRKGAPLSLIDPDMGWEFLE